MANSLIKLLIVLTTLFIFISICVDCYGQVFATINYKGNNCYQIEITISNKGPKTLILEAHLSHNNYLKKAIPSPISYNKRRGVIKWILSHNQRGHISILIWTNKSGNIKAFLKFRNPLTKTFQVIYLKK